jgi:uncharacterized membrane protein YhaH (DUF805 family)
MRIAVLIIGLALTLFLFLQSCAMTVGGDIAGNQSASEGGAVGILIAIMFVVGSAFVLSLPKVSMVIFGLAALLGLAVGATTIFSDMIGWGVIAAALAVMSYFGARPVGQAAFTTVGGTPSEEFARPADGIAGEPVRQTPVSASGGLIACYLQAMRRYVSFSGRASRSEFWYFFLVYSAGTLLLVIADAIIFGPDFGAFPLAGLFNLAHVIPGISVFVRRLHDRDLSGAWFLVAFTGVGYIPLLIIAALPGTQGPHRFGPEPRL